MAEPKSKSAKSIVPRRIRLATMADVLALEALIPTSVRGLSMSDYTSVQVESAIRFVFGVDSQLITDGTYYAVETEKEIVGCGGWSKRHTLYGADKMKAHEDPLLDPTVDAARIRAFFVHPDHARTGIGSLIIDRAMNDARIQGFTRLELMATLPGVPLYKKFDFRPMEEVVDELPDGCQIPLVRMGRSI